MDLSAIDTVTKTGDDGRGGSFIKKNGMFVVLALCVLILACLIYPIGGDYSCIVIGILGAIAAVIMGWLFIKL